MRALLPFTLLFSLAAAAAEPSVFGAGDLNNPNPYGLTNEEKLILENKKEIQAVIQKNNQQHAKVETVTERLDGLQALVEGLVASNAEHKSALQQLSAAKNEDNASSTLHELRKQVDANTQNIEQFKALVTELSAVVDGINANYVTKEQFAALIKQLKINVPAPSAATPAPKTDKASIEKEAHVLFEQKKYAEAQGYFEQMVEIKHKIPEAYFMIGETHFERKAYKEAIYYYKESASKNEKAGYMPTLLLHSGMAMEKMGDAATARAFYQTTQSKYAGTGAAKEAAERLSKLK